jgi:2-phospho-L-lactate guanylyltransferase (CobY/MobA/RfbA family)
MSVLLIPIAPLSRTKSRLRDCFPKELLKDLTIAMFKDLAKKVQNVDSFDNKIVYCHNEEILELAEEFGLIGIKEKLTHPRKSFDLVINDLNNIAIKEYDAVSTIFTFLDVILLSENNLMEISNLMKSNQLVVCPAIHSAGISIFGRNPPDILPTYFSDPNIPSFVALLKNAQSRNLNISVYDSFRAGFDIDIKQDLLLGFEYLKIFDLTETETFQFLKHNLKLVLQKKSLKNNREFKIMKKK